MKNIFKEVIGVGTRVIPKPNFKPREPTRAEIDAANRFFDRMEKLEKGKRRGTNAAEGRVADERAPKRRRKAS